MSSVGQAAPGTQERTGVRAPPGPPRALLVVPKSPQGIFTARKDTDTRTALTRGLAEYIEGVTIEQDDGRKLRFQQVFSSWAEPENIAEYPSAVVYTTGLGTYDSKSFTPVVNESCRIPAPDGRLLVVPAEFVIDITVEVWATDPVERASLVTALEDTFNPFASTYGFTLQLPHYHNVRATFEPMQMGYMDSEVEAVQRIRKAVFMLNARIPLVKLESFPGAKPRADVVSVGPNVIVDGTAPC